MLLYSDELVVLLLLLDTPHVAIKVVVYVFRPIAGAKSLQEQLVVVLFLAILPTSPRLRRSAAFFSFEG